MTLTYYKARGSSKSLITQLTDSLLGGYTLPLVPQPVRKRVIRRHDCLRLDLARAVRGVLVAVQMVNAGGRLGVEV